MQIYLILALVAALGGGTSIVAENAVPGDALYPVKVDINETVRGGLTLSAEGKAEWSVRKAERRLEEAEKLASEGKLDADAEASVKAGFEARADEAIAAIAAVGEKKGAEAAANLNAAFKSSLEAHERVLVNANADADVLASLRMKIGAAEAARAGIGAGAETEASAEGRLTALENKLAEAGKFVSMKAATAGAQATADAKARLTASAALMAQGKARLEAGAWSDAKILFDQAFDAAQEAQMGVNGTSADAATETKADASVKTDTGILKINATGGLKTGIGY